MCKGFYFGMMNIFWNSIEAVVVHFECRWVVHFEMVGFVLGELHLNK